jgi:hypothetical protein
LNEAQAAHAAGVEMTIASRPPYFPAQSGYFYG